MYRYSFAPNPEWTQRYAPGAEIHAYLKDVAKNYDVNQLIRYSSEMTEAAYRDNQWHIQTAQGNQGAFDVVVTATGVLHIRFTPLFAG